MTMPMFTFFSPLPLLRTMSISLIASSYFTVSSAEKKTTFELRLRRISWRRTAMFCGSTFYLFR